MTTKSFAQRHTFFQPTSLANRPPGRVCPCSKSYDSVTRSPPLVNILSHASNHTLNVCVQTPETCHHASAAKFVERESFPSPLPVYHRWCRFCLRFLKLLLLPAAPPRRGADAGKDNRCYFPPVLVRSGRCAGIKIFIQALTYAFNWHRR